MIEWTLSIIKPDGVKKNLVGEIISRFEEDGLSIVGIKMARLNKEHAESFYGIHKDKPFFNSLLEFMTSGNIVVMILEGDNAIAKNRALMGATDPSKADPGTIRRDYATSVEKNVVHGSDSTDTATREINFFFSEMERY